MQKLKFLAANIQPVSGDVIVKARGCVFELMDGRKVLDFSSQTLNLNLGHNHPRIVKAIKRQLTKFSYNSSRFINEQFVELSKTLVDLTDKSLNCVNLKLTNGSDAVESALKRARIAHNKRKIISFYGSHHGETVETIALSGKHFNGRFLGSADEFLYLEKDDMVVENLEQMLRKHKDVAGIILEPVMVNAGVRVFEEKALKGIRSLCDKYKIALIFDEVQTAFGWLGTMFAYERFKVVPDILCLGKGLSAGMPLSAAVFRKKYDVLDYGEDELTYGGHPLSIAAAWENINILKNSDFKIFQKEALMKKLLAKYQAEGMGLIWGVKCNTQERAGKIHEECLKRGLLLRHNGGGFSLTFKPPIIVSELEIREAMMIFDKVWQKL